MIISRILIFQTSASTTQKLFYKLTYDSKRKANWKSQNQVSLKKSRPYVMNDGALLHDQERNEEGLELAL